MRQEKKGVLQPSEGLPRREGAKRPKYTELKEGDVLVGPTLVYLVVRREGRSATFLALIGLPGREGVTMVRGLQNVPLGLCWELLRRA